MPPRQGRPDPASTRSRSPRSTASTRASPLRFPGQGQFHVLKYLSGVVRGGRAARRRHLHRHARSRRSSPARPPRSTPRTARLSLPPASVVVATNTPINDLVAIHTKQAPYLTYAIAAPVPRVDHGGPLSDTSGRLYHYITASSFDGGRRTTLLIVGGEDHKTGQAEAHGDDALRAARGLGPRAFPPRR